MVNKHEEYIKILEMAKASENDAIRLYTAAIGYAPPEDVPKLIEILADENDHDVIDTDLLFKAVAGKEINKGGKA